MSFLKALQILEICYQNPFHLRNWEFIYSTAKKNLYYYHFPFLIHIPLIFVSPYFLFSLWKGNFVVAIRYYMVFLLIGFFYIIYIITFDKIQIYSQRPTINRKKPYFGLLSAIPISANYLLIWIHPVIGGVFFLLSIIYSYILALILWSAYLKKRMIRVLLESFVSLSFFIMILIFILFVFNVWLSYLDLKRFGIL